MSIYRSFQSDRKAHVYRFLYRWLLLIVFVFEIGCIASNAQDAAQPKPASPKTQDEAKLKPALPKLDTSRTEQAPSATPATKHKPSTLQGKVEHSRTMSQPHNFFGLPGAARGGTNENLYRQRVQQRMLDSGITTGIGIIGVKFILFAGRSPIINRVFPLTPAESSGLQPYDVIVAVDGIPTRGLRKEEVYDMIIGTPGTPVTLSIERDGDFKVYNLTRMNINELTDPAIREDYLRSL